MQDTKDIAVAVVGGSLGLAALLVVFIGFLLAHAATFPAQVADRIERRFRLTARWGLAPMAAAVLEAVICYLWLVCRSDHLLQVWVVGFVVVAIGFLVYAVVAIWTI